MTRVCKSILQTHVTLKTTIKPPLHKCQLSFHFNIEFLRPLCKCVLASHAQITPTADYNHIVKSSRPSL